jgi:hypothetical protein
MSISGISGLPTSSSQTASSQADFRQSFNQLATALDSGSLSDAQQAYSALTQLQDSGQGPSANANTPVASVLSQIGQDLQNGDLSGAQQAPWPRSRLTAAIIAGITAEQPTPRRHQPSGRPRPPARAARRRRTA